MSGTGPKSASPWIQAVPGLILWGALALTFILYQPALDGPFTFDDTDHLAGMAAVVDLPSAWTYVFEGRAGPLGRPVALASFLINAPAWPTDVSSLRRTNVLVHLMNGLLLAWLVLRITRLFRTPPARLEWIAVGTACLWVLHPMLASTSLMIIQRMTSLMATFVLLGLLSFVLGRGQLERKPAAGFTVMSLGLSLGTLLAVLTKENGALLPLYALVLEYTLLRPMGARHDYKGFKLWVPLFLVLPVVVLFGYFAAHWESVVASFGIRPFTIGERLLSEARVLFEYLRYILLPSRAGLGPFHEGYPVSTGLLNPPTTLLSLLGLLALAGVAWRWRRHAPALPFAVAWFLAGHSLESSFLSLELYFEHRNYLPAIGPLFALCLLAFSTPVKVRSLVYAGLAGYALLLAFLLHETTLVWRTPALAARLWVGEHPYSPRAYQFLSQQYSQAGDLQQALDVIEEGYRQIPRDAGLGVQVIQLRCALNDLPRNRIETVTQGLRSAVLSYSVGETFKKIEILQGADACPELRLEDLHGMAQALIHNPQYVAAPSALNALHLFESHLYQRERRLDPAVRHLDAAFAIQPELNTAILAGALLASAGLYKEALAHLDAARVTRPRNPWLRKAWDDKFEAMRRALVAARDKTAKR